jgi:hypothetical protein
MPAKPIDRAAIEAAVAELFAAGGREGNILYLSRRSGEYGDIILAGMERSEVVNRLCQALGVE